MKNREAIKMLKTILGTVYLGNRKFIEAVEKAISALEKQEQDRWIPCKDKPPEEDGRYLITEKTDGVKVQEGYFCRTRDGEPYWGYLHVTAWRPLPEPYKAEEES